jgi:hypothetical protein
VGAGCAQRDARMEGGGGRGETYAWDLMGPSSCAGVRGVRVLVAMLSSVLCYAVSLAVCSWGVAHGGGIKHALRRHPCRTCPEWHVICHPGAACYQRHVCVCNRGTPCCRAAIELQVVQAAGNAKQCLHHAYCYSSIVTTVHVWQDVDVDALITYIQDLQHGIRGCAPQKAHRSAGCRRGG